MRYLLCVLLFLLHLTPSSAQMSCGTTDANAALLISHPEYQALRQQADSIMTHLPSASNNSGALIIGGIHYIPIVVHIIHIGDTIGSVYNPTDQQVIDYINVLNQAFSGSYPGYPTPATGGQDIGIQFVLAQRSPDCQPTNGIVRVNAANVLSPNSLGYYSGPGVGYGLYPGISHDTLASISYWPNLDYYNIWLVRAVAGVSAYAYYPLASVATTHDGAVIPVTNVTIGTQNPNMVAHELGHGFDLLHTFEGEFNGNCPPNATCATQGDHVCDTDPHHQVTGGCDSNAINPCTGQPYGRVVYNYMSYSCTNHFTAEQKTRMLNALTYLRPSLDVSLGTTPPGPLLPSPTISISTPMTTYCTGGAASFTATVSYGGMTPFYQWKINGVNTGISTPVFTTTALSNNDVVSCQLTSSMNPFCVSATSATSNSIQVAVNSTPAPTISITANPGNTVCSSFPVTFTATATNTGPFVPFFDWYVNGLLAYQTGTGALTSTYTFNPLNGDVITCRLYANTSCSSSPYLFSNAITMNVTPSAIPALTVTANTLHVCSGDSITVTASYLNAGLNPSISWFVDSGFSVASGPGPVTIPITANATVFAFLYTTAGCTYPPTALSNQLLITIDTPATPAITISALNTSFCPGSLVSFNAATVNGGATPDYTWLVNGAGTGPNAATFSYAPGNHDTVRCQLHSSYGCVTVNPVTSAGIVLNMIDTVSAAVSFLQGGNPFCAGDTIVLAATYSNLGANIIAGRQWLVNGLQAGNTDTLQYVLTAGTNIIQFTTQFQNTPACVQNSVITFFTDTLIATTPAPAPVITSFGSYFSSNYPNGQNQWYAVGTGPLPGEVNQLFYPSFSGSFFDVANAGGCPGPPSDTLQFTLPTGINPLFDADAQFYPNPSSTGGFITPKNLIGQEAIVLSGLGKIVSRLRLGSSLFLGDVPSGIYLLRIVHEGKGRNYRLVVARDNRE